MLGIDSRERPARRSTSGVGAQAGYEYSTQARAPLGLSSSTTTAVFEMDTAFLNRVGITSGWGYVDYNFYPDKDKYPWFRRISPFTFSQGGRDRVRRRRRVHQRHRACGCSFTRQGFCAIDGSYGYETWAGQRFDGRARPHVRQVQLFRWLRPTASIMFGDAVYYDDIDPFQGVGADVSAGATLPAQRPLLAGLEYTRVAFDRADHRRARLHLDIVNSRTTYQFSRNSPSAPSSSTTARSTGC